MNTTITLVLLRKLLEAEKATRSKATQSERKKMEDTHQVSVQEDMTALDQICRMFDGHPDSETLCRVKARLDRSLAAIHELEGYHQGMQDGIQVALNLIIETLKDARYSAPQRD